MSKSVVALFVYCGNKTLPPKNANFYLFVYLLSKWITENEYSRNLTYPDHKCNCIRGLKI